MIKIKRIYDPPSHHDGKRILVDRLWPRGTELIFKAWFVGAAYNLVRIANIQRRSAAVA